RRLAFLVADSGAAVVLTEAEVEGRLTGLGIRIVLVDERMEAGVPVRHAARSSNPRDLAYLIYTSGTTGTPKAVMVSHGNLAATLRATRDAFGWRSGERMPVLAAAWFDIFLFELLNPLLTGGTAVLMPPVPSIGLDELATLLIGMTRLHAVPVLLHQIVRCIRESRSPDIYRGLRTVFVGGDAVPADLLAEVRQAFP